MKKLSKMKIAVIPARGGSKRIPRKNIKEFCGKPMIAWSIDAAKSSGLFDHIIVSTDDAEIVEIAKTWGAEVPFTRPKELSDDYTGTRPVVNHVIRQVEEIYGSAEQVCCLYATAPFVQATDLKRGLDLLNATECEFAFTVTSYPYPIQRALKLTADGRIAMFYPENLSSRSQDLEKAYHDAGQFYWGRTQAFLNEVPTFSQSSAPIILPTYRVQDIDTPEDWLRAEMLFQALQKMEP